MRVFPNRSTSVFHSPKYLRWCHILRCLDILYPIVFSLHNCLDWLIDFIMCSFCCSWRHSVNQSKPNWLCWLVSYWLMALCPRPYSPASSVIMLWRKVSVCVGGGVDFLRHIFIAMVFFQVVLLFLVSCRYLCVLCGENVQSMDIWERCQCSHLSPEEG